MDTWDAIRARRNVRSYRPDPIPEADLQRIVEATWRSTSAKNRQPWDFIVVTDPDQLEELSTVWQGAGHIAKAPATIALVAPLPPDERRKVVDQYDLGQATMAMSIAATDVGIGTGHSSVGDQDKARAILVCRTTISSRICWRWDIPTTGRSSRSASQIDGRSTRSFTAGAGRRPQHDERMTL